MPQIDHVVVLMLENRSFDHMLGYLNHPSPDFDGVLQHGPFFNLTYDGTDKVETSKDAKPVMPVDPDHAHDAVMEQLGCTGQKKGQWNPSNEGFVSSLEKKGRNLAIPEFGGLLGPLVRRSQQKKAAKKKPIENMGHLAMKCHDPEHVPVLSTLALEFAVFTRWFCSVPGETWPNRNFVHAATSDGETNINPRWYNNKTIFELLEENGRDWHIYHDDTPQVWAFHELWEHERKANWFDFSVFKGHVENDKLPAYSFIEPNHRPPFHLMDQSPVRSGDVSNNQHPGNNMVSVEEYENFNTDEPIDFVRAEALLANVYETLRKNPKVFERTLFLVTYDEHGGLYDHVSPPTGVPSPQKKRDLLRSVLGVFYKRKSKMFDFTMLGARVPAIAISPFIDRNTVSTEVHDHASVPSTLRALFAPKAKPLTARDEWATPFHNVMNRQTARTDMPDLSSAKAIDTPAESSSINAPKTVLDPNAVPDYYDELAALSDKVNKKLRRQGVDDARVARRAPAPTKTVQTSTAFKKAATAEREQTNAARLLAVTP